MAKRKPIPEELVLAILHRNRHTCCLCREPRHSVEIHHIDGDPAHNVDVNLAVLCRNCHGLVSGDGGLGRKYTAGEVTKYKQEWEQHTARTRPAAFDGQVIASEYAPRILVGRKAEHLRLKQMFANRPAIALLTGPSGIGKTALALQFLHEKPAPFQRYVYQVCGDRHLDDIVRDLATSLGVDVGSAPPAQAKAIKDVLRIERSLLVLDDVRSDSVRALIPGPNTSVLLTSIRKDFPTVSPVNTIELASLTEADAFDLFQKAAGALTPTDMESLRPIVQLCDGLPLALSSIASMLMHDQSILNTDSARQLVNRIVSGAARGPIAALFGALRHPTDAIAKAASVCTSAASTELLSEIAGIDHDAGRRAVLALVNEYSMLRYLREDGTLVEIHPVFREYATANLDLSHYQNRMPRAVETLLKQRGEKASDTVPHVLAGISVLVGLGSLAAARALAGSGQDAAWRRMDYSSALRIGEQESHLLRQIGGVDSRFGLLKNQISRALVFLRWRDTGRARASIREGIDNALALRGQQPADLGLRAGASSLLSGLESKFLESGDRVGLLNMYLLECEIYSQSEIAARVLFPGFDFEGAITKCGSLAKELGDKDGLKSHYKHLGALRLRQGRHREAIEALQSERSYHGMLLRTAESAVNSLNLALAHSRSGRKAASFVFQDEAQFRESTKSLRTALGFFGETDVALGSEEAEECAMTAHELGRRTQSFSAVSRRVDKPNASVDLLLEAITSYKNEEDLRKRYGRRQGLVNSCEAQADAWIEVMRLLGPTSSRGRDAYMNATECYLRLVEYCRKFDLGPAALAKASAKWTLLASEVNDAKTLKRALVPLIDALRRAERDGLADQLEAVLESVRSKPA